MIPNFRMVRYLTLQVARVSSLDGIGARVFACSGLPWRRNVLPTVKSVRADRVIPQFLGQRYALDHFTESVGFLQQQSKSAGNCDHFAMRS
jgi:hypothetical protein